MATDQQNGGLQAQLVIDRDTASRLGITPQMIDDTLYDAFGQRQVSTMFTQLNQYHVVLEVEAGVPAESGRPERHLSSAPPTAAQVPLSAFTHFEHGNRAAGRQSPGPVPGGHPFVQSGARRVAGRRGERASTSAKQELGHAGQHPGDFQGTARPSKLR